MKKAIDVAGVHDSVAEYASEFFHVENLMAYQLADASLDVPPRYILEQCDAIMLKYAQIAGYDIEMASARA